MRTDIIEYLQKEVYHRCKRPTNKFGMGCYYHIEAVVKNAEILAEKYGADKEVVITAAWIHDIASITDYDRITLVGGDSGTGKTVFYEMFEDIILD